MIILQVLQNVDNNKSESKPRQSKRINQIRVCQLYSKCFSLNLEIRHISHENEIAISYKWKEPWFREKQRLKLKFRRKRKHKFVKSHEKSIKINNKYMYICIVSNPRHR